MTQTALERLAEERNEAEYAAILKRATTAEARVAELAFEHEAQIARLETSVRVLRNALSRQEDICARSHWAAR